MQVKVLRMLQEEHSAILLTFIELHLVYFVYFETVLHRFYFMLIELLFFFADHEVKYSLITDVVLNEGRILHSEISHYIKKTKK